MGLTSFQCLLTAAGAVVSLWTTQMLSAVLPGLLSLGQTIVYYVVYYSITYSTM